MSFFPAVKIQAVERSKLGIWLFYGVDAIFVELPTIFSFMRYVLLVNEQNIIKLSFFFINYIYNSYLSTHGISYSQNAALIFKMILKIYHHYVMKLIMSHRKLIIRNT